MTQNKHTPVLRQARLEQSHFQLVHPSNCLFATLRKSVVNQAAVLTLPSCLQFCAMISKEATLGTISSACSLYEMYNAKYICMMCYIYRCQLLRKRRGLCLKEAVCYSSFPEEKASNVCRAWSIKLCSLILWRVKLEVLCDSLQCYRQYLN